MHTQKLALLFFSNLNFLIRKITRTTHRKELSLRWSHQREIFFDRTLAINTAQSNDISLIFERIIFNKLFLSPDGRVLELGFGDGFAGSLMYASGQKSYVGIDNSLEALKFANRNYQNPNVYFKYGNIMNEFPSEKFTNVIWDAGIGFFTPSEQSIILNLVSKCLEDPVSNSHGILSGFTIGTEISTHQNYTYAPNSKSELYRILELHFKSVFVVERVHRNDRYFYFAASNSLNKVISPNVSFMPEVWS